MYLPKNKTLEEREAIVNDRLAKLTNPTNYQLDELATYLISKDKKDKTMVSDNHQRVINGRETSLEFIMESLERSDAFYSMIRNDKNIIFHHKIEITPQDKADIPYLNDLADVIEALSAQRERDIEKGNLKNSRMLKKTLIETYKDQYEVKLSEKPPIRFNKTNVPKELPRMNLDENITINEETGEPKSDGYVSLFNPDHVFLLLANYSQLKQESYDDFNSDIHWLMIDLDNLIEKVCDKNPKYKEIIIFKIDGLTNEQIYTQTGFYTTSYISTVWRKKIPEAIAEQAKDDYIQWYYTEKAKGKYKYCRKCAQWKLLIPRYWPKNKDAKDGYYSVCKECKNKREKEARDAGKRTKYNSSKQLSGQKYKIIKRL